MQQNFIQRFSKGNFLFLFLQANYEWLVSQSFNKQVLYVINTCTRGYAHCTSSTFLVSKCLFIVYQLVGGDLKWREATAKCLRKLDERFHDITYSFYFAGNLRCFRVRFIVTKFAFLRYKVCISSLQRLRFIVETQTKFDFLPSLHRHLTDT